MTHSVRVGPATEEKSQQQEPEADGHIISAVRKQPQINVNYSDHFPLSNST